ncbi:MAG: phospholipase C, phosphocholine-specific [Acetobacter syzygii]|uniref:phosphocholine-specific phospholipase C n=1 Tax=Acetobacter syzygii TaxID=146476 RepID=UPI0039EB63F4
MATRRNFLKYALLSGAVGSAGMVPASIRRALAIAPDPGTTYLDAEHVVILMQENRSFDHMFGSLQGVRGFNDPRGIRQPNGEPVFLQSNSKGETYLPWRLNIHDTRITWMGSIPHSRDSQVDAWNGGYHNRWIDVKKSHHKGYDQYPMTMGYYTREDLPFYYALADAFTVCDQNYCGVMSSTTPNRLVFWTGTVRDKQKADSTVYMRNPEILEGGMTWTTFPERLEHAGVSWKFYQNEIEQTANMSGLERSWLANFSCNVLECFDQYNVSANPGFQDWIDARITECSKHIDRLSKQEMLVSEKKEEQLKEARSLLAVLQRRKNNATRSLNQLSAEERSLFEKAFVTNKDNADYRSLEKISFSDDPDTRSMYAPKGDVLYQFRQDVHKGQLPTVSWLAAPEHFSDHPTSPWYGAWYVSEIMDILTENPEVWKKTIFIITYDENDGYFDHCCSYAAPDPLRPETGRSSASIGADGLEYTYAKDEEALDVPHHLARSGPIGFGFRVPMVVASPWSRGGWVNSQLFEHSSTLRFLETFIEGKFGKSIKETNISPWRRAISGDLSSCFRPYDGSVPHLPFLERNKHLETIEDAKNRPFPGGFKVLDSSEIENLTANPQQLRQYAKQEPGTRPACALPYELYCNGGLGTDRKTVVIELKAGKALHGSRSAGAPFNIYCHGTQQTDGMQVGTYAVAAGDLLKENFETILFNNNIYDISVHAPNGFYRRFKGHTNGSTLQVACEYQPLPHHGIILKFLNTSNKAIDIVCASAGHNKTFHIPPHTHGRLEIETSHTDQWYDVTITTPADPDFLYVFAGHAETGEPSRTDPAMG